MKKHTLSSNEKHGYWTMKSVRTFCALLTIGAVSIGTGSDAIARITEPDVVYFGTLAGGAAGNIVTLKLDADTGTLKTATVASDTRYVLRIPMDSVEPRVAGTFRSGDKATLYLGDKVLRTVVIADRGSLVNLPLSATLRTLADWQKEHPGDDGSGDKNQNGISDLQDFLNGNDPYSSIMIAVTLSTLATNSITAVNPLNVAGTVSESGNGVKNVTVNGQVAPLTNGSFTVAIPLVAGPNIITTIATDNFDNKTVDTRTITLNRAASGVIISQPADNSITGKSFADITGSVTDPTATVTARVNDGTVSSAAMNGSNFSITVNLLSGMNTIDITATAATGSSSVKRSVTSDAVAPTLAITDPAQDSSTSRNSLTLSGMVTNSVTSATVSIAVDGQNYTPTVAGDGRFSQAIPLPTDKSYAVSVTAIDQAGNKATVQRNIIKTSGDINGDGVVDIADAVMVLRVAVGLVTPTTDIYARADVAPLKDGNPAPDGIIDIGDVVIILQSLVQ